MRHVSNILLWEYWLSIAISLIMVLLYETDVMTDGVLADCSNEEFVVLTIMELLTICLIPISLRLFRVKRIHKQLTTDLKEQRLLVWGSVRLMMLCLPMIANVLFYYLFMHVGFGYLAIILFLSLFFIYPSMTRCLNETDSSNS